MTGPGRPGELGRQSTGLLDARKAFLGLVASVEGGALSDLDDPGLVHFMREFEQFRNLLPRVDHTVILEGEARGLAGAVGEPTMRRLLVHLLRLSPAEAARRVAAAAACGRRLSMLGELLEPPRAELAAAQREGMVSPEQVQIIDSALARVDRPGFDQVDIVAGERLLVGFALEYGTKDLRHLASRVVDAIDPDGTLPDEQVQQDRRHWTMRQCRDGMYAGEFRLTAGAGAKLAAILQPLSRPRLDTLVSEGSSETVCDDDSSAPVGDQARAGITPRRSRRVVPQDSFEPSPRAARMRRLLPLRPSCSVSRAKVLGC